MMALSGDLLAENSVQLTPNASPIAVLIAPAMVLIGGGKTLANCAPPIDSIGRDSLKNKVSSAENVHCCFIRLLLFQLKI